MTKFVSAQGCIAGLLTPLLIGCATTLEELPPLPGIQHGDSLPQLSELPDLPQLNEALQAPAVTPAHPPADISVAPLPASPQPLQTGSATLVNTPPVGESLADTNVQQFTSARDISVAPAVSPELRPRELNPEELNPEELNPEELNPEELEPLEQQPSEQPRGFNEVTLVVENISPAETLPTLESSSVAEPPQVTLVELEVLETTLPTASSQNSISSVVNSSNPQPATTDQEQITPASATQTDENTSDVILAFVASDLVSALTYLPPLSPSLTSVDTSGSRSEFSQHVKSSMQMAGYSVDADSGETEKHRLTTTLNQTIKTPLTREVSASLSIDGANIGRKYLIRNDNVAPVTSYFVRGVDPSLVDPSGPVISIR